MFCLNGGEHGGPEWLEPWGLDAGVRLSSLAAVITVF